MQGHGLTGLPVAHATFEDYEPQGPYNGIWACSSLMHVPLAQLPTIIGKYAAALGPGGAFYLSFKYGTFEGIRHGRWFNDMDEESLRVLVAHVEGLKLDEIEVTSESVPTGLVKHGPTHGANLNRMFAVIPDEIKNSLLRAWTIGAQPGSLRVQRMMERLFR